MRPPMQQPAHWARRRGRPLEAVVRLVAATGLACDAYVHLDLAAGFDANRAP